MPAIEMTRIINWCINNNFLRQDFGESIIFSDGLFQPENGTQGILVWGDKPHPFSSQLLYQWPHQVIHDCTSNCRIVSIVNSEILFSIDTAVEYTILHLIVYFLATNQCGVTSYMK